MMEPDKELFIVRHGETEWNKNRKYQGQKDVKLNETGKKQVRLSAEELAEFDLEAVCSSNLSRARDTAEEIAASHQLQVRQFAGLREIDFGDWEGKSYEEIIEQQKERFHDWLQNPGRTSPPGGEDMQEFQQRVCRAFEQILEFSADKIAVAAHGGSIRVYMLKVLGMPLENYTRLHFDNGGISRIKYFQDSPVVTQVNTVGHLDGSLQKF